MSCRHAATSQLRTPAPHSTHSAASTQVGSHAYSMRAPSPAHAHLALLRGCSRPCPCQRQIQQHCVLLHARLCLLLLLPLLLLAGPFSVRCCTARCDSVVVGHAPHLRVTQAPVEGQGPAVAVQHVQEHALGPAGARVRAACVRACACVHGICTMQRAWAGSCRCVRACLDVRAVLVTWAMSMLAMPLRRNSGSTPAHSGGTGGQTGGGTAAMACARA